MCVLKISMPVFSICHFISSHFKFSILLLFTIFCSSFLIPVICAFPVFSVELVFCASSNVIFTSKIFFFFNFLPESWFLFPPVDLLSVAQDVVVLLQGLFPWF